MTDTSIDHEARKDVETVRVRLDAHEKHCEERWELTNNSLGKLEASINSLDVKLSSRIAKVHERIDAMNFRLILVLIAIAGFAIVQWFLFAGVAQSGM